MQLWAMQTKLQQEDATKHLVDAFQKLGLNWAAFPLVPFVHHIPDFQWNDGPIVYYGSTGLVKTISESPELLAKACLYFNPETHSPSAYKPVYGSEYLNAGALRQDVKTFLASHSDNVDFFIRPDSGLKTFSGKVFSVGEFRRYVEAQPRLYEGHIITAPCKPIVREYRNWVFGGEVAASVGYRRHGKVDPWLEVPEEVKTYAKQQATVYEPSPGFVLDVAETPDGFKVIEINCVHAAGFYKTEVILDVVAEWSNFVAKSE